jgi:phosphohistidine phosphatase
LRHAKAEPDSGEGDEARPLAKKGRRAAERVGELLSDRLPNVVLASTARRTRETVEYFRKGAGPLGRVEFLPELYLAEPAVYLRALATHAGNAERVLIVGHNPGLEDLVTRLTGEKVHLPTAGLAECALELASFSDITLKTGAELVALRHPRDED